jgi:hypothetical protein
VKRLAAALIAIALGATCGAAPPERLVANDSSACRLPIGSAVSGVGGFLTYPAGDFSSDSTSAVSYSARHHRWLPALRQFISPDEASYLRFDYSKVSRATSLYVVDIASGSERPLPALGPSAFALAWSASGIYFVQHNGSEPEVWVLDPAKQTSRMVASPSKQFDLPLFKAWSGFGGGAVWAKTVENTAGPAGDVLVRIDLAGGHTETWYREKTPSSLDVLGFSPDGQPLVMGSSGGGNRMLLLTGPGKSSPIGSGTYRYGPGTGTGVSDGHGLWLLGADGGVWLYRNRSLISVGSAKLPPPTSSEMGHGPMRPNLSIAGPCA